MSSAQVPARANTATLRRAESRDVEPCGRICYEAFRSIAEKHKFPPDCPSPEVGISVIGMLFSNPGFYCIVAESEGRIVGSKCLDERCAISGLGPITIDPAVQDSGIGRRLMQAVIEHSDQRTFPGVRLVQAAYHMRSLSLYTKFGFASREQLAVMGGFPMDAAMKRYQVRPLIEADLPVCNQLCTYIHGFHRGGELQQAIAANSAFVAERDGAIRAYTSGLGYFGHSIGETTESICALLALAPHMPSLGVLIPMRNYALFHWCLNHGMRTVMTMTLMTRGIYQDPNGPYLPSILY